MYCYSRECLKGGKPMHLMRGALRFLFHLWIDMNQYLMCSMCPKPRCESRHADIFAGQGFSVHSVPWSEVDQKPLASKDVWIQVLILN